MMKLTQKPEYKEIREETTKSRKVVDTGHKKENFSSG